jgi:polysaccharide transporter, PST family
VRDIHHCNSGSEVNIVRASALTSVATSARLLSSLVIVKLVASFAGPEGVGKLGQLLSVISLLAVFGGGGIGSGIVKYVAELRNSIASLKKFLGSAAFFTIISSSVITAGALIFRQPLTLYLLQDSQYQGLIVILAVIQPF